MLLEHQIAMIYQILINIKISEAIKATALLKHHGKDLLNEMKSGKSTSSKQTKNCKGRLKKKIN